MTSWNYSGVIPVPGNKNGVRQPARVCSQTHPCPTDTFKFLWTSPDQKHPQPYSRQQLQLQPWRLKVTPWNWAIASDPNQPSFSKQHLLPAAIIILDKQHMWLTLALWYCLCRPSLPFFNSEQHSSSVSWICVPGCSPNKPQITFFFYLVSSPFLKFLTKSSSWFSHMKHFKPRSARTVQWPPCTSRFTYDHLPDLLKWLYGWNILE